MLAIHSHDGRHFLGLRQARGGDYEIVYVATADGRRLIWKISHGNIEEAEIAQQFEKALRTAKVLETLFSGLRAVELEFEAQV